MRLELVFFKTGFPRVPKVFNIIGEAKRWDSASQLFKGNDSLTAQKNELILKEKVFRCCRAMGIRKNQLDS